MRGRAFNRVGTVPFAIMALALASTAVIAAPAEVTRSADGSSLDAAITSKVGQLAAVKLNISEAGCDYAVDAAIIEACDQLTAQAQKLAAEIDALKAETAEASLAKAPSPQAKLYSFKARTNPNMSYRTFCVRECDGFYYPLSEASTPDSFLAGEAKCQSSCSSPAKLFYSATPGEDAGAMVALTGERYDELANAFRYRSEYVDGCACKPKPWTAEARVLFDRRAILATRTPNERIVAAGTDEVGKLLTAPETKVAVHAAGGKSRYSQMIVERPRFLPFFRPFRYAFAGAPEGNERLPQHRFFLFRGRL